MEQTNFFGGLGDYLQGEDVIHIEYHGTMHGGGEGIHLIESD